MSHYTIPVYYRNEIEHIRQKLLQRILFVYWYTGQWAMPSHPYLRSLRPVWSSDAKPGSIMGRHLPATYERNHHA